MHWSNLPLIDMDEYEGKDADKSNSRNSRPRDNDNGDHLEMDISKQLSQLREQSKSSSDQGSKPDPFGRDIDLRKMQDGGKTEGQRAENRLQADEGNSSQEWRKGRDGDGDRGGYRGGDRNRDRRKDHEREQGEYSDGSQGSWDGGRDGDKYKDRSRDEGWSGDRYRGRRDGGYRDDYRDRDYRDHNYRDRDYRDRDYRDRDYRERDWRRDRYNDRDDYRRDYRDRNNYDKDNYRSHDRYQDDRDYHRREFRYAEPTEIVILKGLPTNIEDSQIHELVTNANLPYKDVRIVKNREGFSRGFAFVEFIDVETAKGWIESCKGKIQLGDSCVYMDFSRSSKGSLDSHKDWICGKCGTQNFYSKRRNTCFSCYAPRDENDEQKDIGQTPCKVLILRGLDTLTTEETIRHCLSSFTAIPIFDVRLIKDKMTGTSRGFCFIELGSIEEATKLLEEIQGAHFKVDERSVAVSYARFGTQPASSSGTAAKSASGSASSANDSSVSTTTGQAWPQNNFAANAIAQAHAAAKMGNTNDPIGQEIPAAQSALPTIPAAPPVSYPPDPSVTPAAQPQPVVPPVMPVIPGQEQSAPTVPAAFSTYVYDAASGYYYDTSTGLYYDSKTQYYFNATTQQYMYWDVATQQYVAVVSSSVPAPPTAAAAVVDPNAVTTATPNIDPQGMSKEKQKKAKSLNAKKIAKDMERWAKKVNVNKDNQARSQTQQSTDDGTKESTYQYDPNELKKTGIKISFSGNAASLSLSSSSPLAALSDFDDAQDAAPAADSTAAAAASSLVAEYGGDSGGEEDANKEDNFADWTKMACLLCKRQFPSKEVLTKHNQFSDLHKQNLQVQKKLKMSFTEIDDYERQQREAKYRDRAKERRELFGQPDSTPAAAVAAIGNKRKRGKGKTVYEQPTKDGITSDNIGNKMLQAMGWTQGTGLGRERQGIVAPISAKIRNRTAGLGLEGSDYGAVAGDTERLKLKKMASSRYDSLE